MATKKKVKEVERELYRVRVVDDEHCEVTREAEPGERWDNDDVSYDHYIKGIKLVDHNEYGDIDLGYKPEEGKLYYLLYVTYSTGDSFHREDGRISFVDLYRTREEAEENVKLMREHYEKARDRRFERIKKEKFNPYSVELKNHEGNVFSFHCPYVGYFERLSSIEVESVYLK